MLGGIFETVFQASVRASLLILTVFLLKMLFRHRVNNKWHTVIWAVVAVRLIIPWAPQSHLSLFNVVKSAEKAARETLQEDRDFSTDLKKRSENIRVEDNVNTRGEPAKEQIVGDTEIGAFEAINENLYKNIVTGGVLTGPKRVENTGIKSAMENIAWIWLAGCVIFMFVFPVMNLLLHIRIKRGMRLKGRRVEGVVAECMAISKLHGEMLVKETDGISTPMLYGIRRPVIILPLGMADTLTDNELRHVILHEFMHYRKRDNVTWIIVLAIRAIHWFNPLVHLAAAVYRNNNEEYCDSMVLEFLGEEESNRYGRTLVRLARGYRRSVTGLASTISGGAGSLKKRILGVARFRKGTCRWSITAVVILVLVACMGLSNEVDGPGIMDYQDPVELHIYTKECVDDVGAGSKMGKVDVIETPLPEVGMKLSDSLKVTPVFHRISKETYADEIEKLIKAGEPVDVVATCGGYEFYDRDVLMDLSIPFPEHAPDYYNELMSHGIGIQKLESCTIDDKLVCIPSNDLSTQRAFVLARKDLAEQFAPDGFETLEDYGEFMAQVKEQYPMMTPGYVDTATFFQTYLRGNGYFEYQSSFLYKSWDPQRWDEYYPMERLDEFGAAYNMLQEWYVKEYTKKTAYDIELWLAMGGMGSVLMSGIDVDRYMIGAEYEFVADPLYTECPYEALVKNTGVSVGKTCDCPERVMMLVEWIHSSQEAYDLFMYGVENKNYVLEGDKISFVSDEIDIQPIHDCPKFYSMDCFTDFRYSRPREYHPDGFKDLYSDACLENVVTSKEIFEKVLGVDVGAYREAAIEISDELEKNMDKLEKYLNNIYKEINYINKEFFWHEPAEIIRIQKETGIDEYLDIQNKLLKNIRAK